MNNEEISFVLQGPLVKNVTEKSISNIRQLFPRSTIILSTWENQKTDEINADLIIKSKDPSSTVMAYDKNNAPRTTNVNRQIYSTKQGLKAVKTKYSVKLRTDNIITSNAFVKYYNKYNQYEKKYSLFSQRIITSNFFAKEIEKGLKIPYFFSDFFHFGKTEDLIALWDIPLFQNYRFQQDLSGVMQHKNSPYRPTHVEQDLWISFLNKYNNVSLHDEFGTKTQRIDTYNYMINNFIILDESQLRLKVPKRLEQSRMFPYDFYDHFRWKWIYENTFKIPSSVPTSYKFRWYTGYLYKLLRKGITYKIKSIFLY